MAPEYMMRGNYSTKSDAFSFGVMVMEIITGRKNGCCNSDDLLTTVSVINLIAIIVALQWSLAHRACIKSTPTEQVWEHWDAGTAMETVDPSMAAAGIFSEVDVLRCIHVGLLCVQPDPAARPVMSSVLVMLGCDTITLQAPSKPMLFLPRNTAGNTTLSTVSLQG